jgi:glycosyltransferase involved in cell wall biosynthesis
MKLLIITQVIDSEHPILGFFHRWVEEFATHCEQVHVICLQAGKQSLPANVTVHSLGKEEGKGRLVYLFRFYKLIWQLRHEYDHVFVHMNQIYVILGAPFWRAAGKKVGLWYVHKATSCSLWLAEKATHFIFTSTKESFTLPSKKVYYLGHGIDIARFHSKKQAIASRAFTVAHIGRITKIKNIDIFLAAAKLLHDQGKSFRYLLYGEPVTIADQHYFETLKKTVLELELEKEFLFCGAVHNTAIPTVLQSVDVTVNLTPTGGLDKAVIESAAAGVPIIATNQAFVDFFGHYQSSLLIPYQDAAALAIAIERLATLSPKETFAMSEFLRQQSLKFDVASLILRVCAIMEK